MKKRRFTISGQDTDGNHPFYGTMTAAQQAVITAAITPLSHRGSLVNVSDKEDTRSLAERRMDALAYICEQHLKATSANNSYGIASLVISTTADELAHLTAATELPTNTGTLLTWITPVTSTSNAPGATRQPGKNSRYSFRNSCARTRVATPPPSRATNTILTRGASAAPPT